MSIVVEFFAVFRELSGQSKVEKSLKGFKDLRALYLGLQKEYDFHIKIDSVKVAVNDEFVNWDYSLSEGDRIVFIPPVAGG